MTGGSAAGSGEMYDVVIVGATPAGGAAAIRARQAGLRTLLLADESCSQNHHRLDWLGPAATELCAACGLSARKVRAAQFRGLRLCSWDLKKSSRVADAELTGWIVDRARFDEALLEAVRRSGTDVIAGGTPEGLTLGERHVILHLPGEREIRGRLLLIADGLDSATAALARMPMARRSEGVAACADVLFKAGTQKAGMDVIIGARRIPQLVTIMRAGEYVRIALMTRVLEPPAEQQLEEFVEAARAATLIPKARAAQPVCSQTPAGVALDLETHVGKRCVLIGEVGGFVSAFSNEAIYPCMSSGWTAADAADRALQAPVLQDELSSFSSVWRAELADYLRLPNTDLALLMPLVFNNPQMSARVARAFLLGQGF